MDDLKLSRAEISIDGAEGIAFWVCSLPDNDEMIPIMIKDVPILIDYLKKLRMVKMVNLGDKVKDEVSGFTGIAVSCHSYLNGCNRITVQPAIDKDKKLPKSATFDEPQLKVMKTKVVKLGSKLTGGTNKYMDEGR